MRENPIIWSLYNHSNCNITQLQKIKDQYQKWKLWCISSTIFEWIYVWNSFTWKCTWYITHAVFLLGKVICTVCW